MLRCAAEMKFVEDKTLRVLEDFEIEDRTIATYSYSEAALKHCVIK